MKIIHGLLPGQVLQRNASGYGSAVIKGTCKGAGDVQLCVTKGERNTVVKEWYAAGAATGKKFIATLEGVRSGGPYTVSLRVVRSGDVIDQCSIEDLYVGDVWFLAGQSNMEGVGNMDQAPKPHQKVRAFYMRDEWSMAEEKLHFLSEAVDPVHNGYGRGSGRPTNAVLRKQRAMQSKGVSPGVTFGIEMYKRSRVPQGLVACAHGGTSMQQWSPSLLDQGGASLYGAMLRRYEKLGEPIAGIVWYQGESDANKKDAPLYTKRMIELVAATRKDMGLPKLPWTIVQIGRHANPENGDSWNQVQEAQRVLPEKIWNLDVVPAVDLDLDDGIHISGKGQAILGKRLARAASVLVYGKKGEKQDKPSLRLDGVDIIPTPGYANGMGGMSVRLHYKNVVGSLQSAGLPTGFSLRDGQGNDVCGFYKTTLHRNTVILHTNMSRFQLESYYLYYGYGRMPYCNIVDSMNLSLPVCAHVPISTNHPQSV